jgi:hypothetical protein
MGSRTFLEWGPSWSPTHRTAAPRPSPGQAAGASQAGSLGDSDSRVKVNAHRIKFSLLTAPGKSPRRASGPEPSTLQAQSLAPWASHPCPVGPRAPLHLRKPRLTEGCHLPTDAVTPCFVPRTLAMACAHENPSLIPTAETAAALFSVPQAGKGLFI